MECVVEDNKDSEFNAIQADDRIWPNQPVPALAIPPEVLILIIRMAQKVHPQFATPVELLASYVCSSWRSVVVGTPILWSQIKFRHRTRDILSEETVDNLKLRPWWKDLKILELYTTRFGSCLLDIILEFEDWSEYLKLLAPHAGQFRRLSLISPNEPRVGLEKLLCESSTPFLEYVHFDFPAPWEPIIDPTIPTIFTRGCPLLTLANIRCGNAFKWYPPLQALTTLTLDGYHSCLSDSLLRDTLVSMPMLNNLSLLVNTVDDHKPLQQVALPSIRWLRVTYLETIRWLNRNVLSMPNLDTLELYMTLTSFLTTTTGQQNTFPPYRPFSPLRIFSSVHTLVVRDFTQRGPISRHVATGFPHISTLILDDDDHPLEEVDDLWGFSLFNETWREEMQGHWDPPIFEFEMDVPLRDSRPELPWPDLQTLYLVNADSLSNNAFMRSLQRRKRAGHPISTLIIEESADTLATDVPVSTVATVVERRTMEQMQRETARLWTRD